MNLKLGHISYLNCVPFFYHLRECGFAGEIVKGVPAELNRMLATGRIDLAPASAWEYAVRPEDYILLPGHSISSIGPVHSVLLFSPAPPEELAGQTISLTGESATSIHLLQVLLERFYRQEQIKYEVPPGPVEDAVQAGQPTLLIGDRALQARKRWPELPFYDLGDMWWGKTGLPYVFALWIVRREVAEEHPGELSGFLSLLNRARELSSRHYLEIAYSLGDGQALTPEEISAYWEQVSYDLSPDHLAGLQRFWAECLKHGLLERLPEAKLFQPPT
ncbi:MAG: futalosine synthase [Desulfuromonas sp.]|nr:MAG: futalosine synthase [Desulfuromonas sp.]